MLALPSRRLAREAVPVAAILLFWNLLAGVAHFQNVGGPVGSAGIVMATLYVAVRGVSLSAEVLPPATVDPRAVVYENAQLAVPAGAWFVTAMVVGAVEVYIVEFTWIISSVRTALAGAGLGVVGLYAVAAGFAAFDKGPSAEAPRADDRESSAGDSDVS